jgi:hypothetical protein
MLADSSSGLEIASVPEEYSADHLFDTFHIISYTSVPVAAIAEQDRTMNLQILGGVTEWHCAQPAIALLVIR